MSVVPVICLVAAGVFMLAARTYEADRRSVGGVEPALDANRLDPQPA
jgi:hypothetical protein